jgi:Protein of unknown function (DUF732)
MPCRKLSANSLRKHSEPRHTKASAPNTLDESAMTTTPNPQPIPGLAVFAALGVAIGAISGVSVFYWKHDHVGPGQSTPVSQAASGPPAVTPSAMDKDGRFLWQLATQGLELERARDVAINDARRVCSRLERGESEQQIVQDIVRGSGMSMDTATSFAETAIDVYCPEG